MISISYITSYNHMPYVFYSLEQVLRGALQTQFARTLQTQKKIFEREHYKLFFFLFCQEHYKLNCSPSF